MHETSCRGGPFQSNGRAAGGCTHFILQRWDLWQQPAHRGWRPGGQLTESVAAVVQALDPGTLGAPASDSWRALALRSEKSVLVCKGELATVCEPGVPYAFDQRVPEELAQAWLGSRLALARKHMYGSLDDTEAAVWGAGIRYGRCY